MITRGSGVEKDSNAEARIVTFFRSLIPPTYSTNWSGRLYCTRTLAVSAAVTHRNSSPTPKCATVTFSGAIPPRIRSSAEYLDKVTRWFACRMAASADAIRSVPNVVRYCPLKWRQETSATPSTTGARAVRGCRQRPSTTSGRPSPQIRSTENPRRFARSDCTRPGNRLDRYSAVTGSQSGRGSRFWNAKTVIPVTGTGWFANTRTDSRCHRPTPLPRPGRISTATLTRLSPDRRSGQEGPPRTHVGRQHTPQRTARSNTVAARNGTPPFARLGTAREPNLPE